VTELPEGFGVALDPSVRVYAGGTVLVGGDPVRVLRLTSAGVDAVAALGAGGRGSPAARRLGRRLVDAGLAHPRPPGPQGQPDVTVVVPVRDRAASLDRCLQAVGGEVPVVVVDDGSTDPPAVAAVAARHGARLLVRPVGGGPAAARGSARLPLAAHHPRRGAGRVIAAAVAIPLFALGGGGSSGVDLRDTGGNAVAALDSGSGAVGGAVEAPAAPTALAAGLGYVWAASAAATAR